LRFFFYDFRFVIVKRKTTWINLQDVICPEAVKLDDIDPSSVTSQFEASKAAFASAAAGSLEQAEAQIEMEVSRAMGLALGMNLA
jgi:hypothetical protein